MEEQEPEKGDTLVKALLHLVTFQGAGEKKEAAAQERAFTS